MRVDRTVRTAQDGRLLFGGSPSTLFRLTAAGADWFARLRSGSATAATPGEATLADRWIDAGLLHPEPPPGSGPFDASDVAVVVPVRDRADGVARLLASLDDDGAPIAQVLVVDDGSVDPAALEQVVAHRSSTVQVLRRDRSGGPAAARDDGAAAADPSARVLLVIDSDCTVEPGWLDPLLAAFADPAVAAVAPRVRARPAAGVLAAYETARSPLDLGTEPARVAPGTRVSYVPSAALALRRDRWDELGGFDPELRVGEDVDLVWRLDGAGGRVRYEPRATVVHDPRPDLRAWLAQRVAYGSSAAPLALRHPGRLAPAAFSPWSLAVWALAAVGRPDGAAALAIVTTVQLADRLGDVPRPLVLRIGLGGHLGAGRQLAEAVVRVWWPLALPAACLLPTRRARRRARRVLGVAATWTVLSAARESRRRGVGTPPDPVRFAALVLLDHAAYGAGVWRGVVQHRTLAPLLPRLVRSGRRPPRRR